MRIVGGAARGRRLAPPADGTRPTSDQAREGMFNTLAARWDLVGSRVLDLYAGTGAVGLEALSRGAAEVVLVESGRRAAAVLRRNVDAVALPGARVLARTVEAVVRDPADAAYDLVFADPPYALADAELAAVLADVVGRGWLADDGVLVVERAARGPEPAWPDMVSRTSQRRYGEAMFWYVQRR